MCDVYSFGVVLLEMLTGQRALEEDRSKHEERDIVKWARPHIKKHEWRAIIDPTIVEEFPEKLAYRAFLIAYHCTRTDSHGTARPAMPVVVRGLECTLNLAFVAPRPRHE
ncbi:putative receptor protein kinase CRINKLY4 [Acorus calamus]|uniref:Receptor protein kinase CRINKLY4 n=1 Tax=Acorus calamus TaxID=4465 RepID=A0AAV9D3S6_ACOCL|nr:putative receptor protein kinase CRINKLY4 [Acorus calamus]